MPQSISGCAAFLHLHCRLHRYARLAWGALLLLAALPSLGGPPAVQANGETLHGLQSEVAGVSAFLGVPFAQPPVADLRWQAPQAHAGNGGTRQATAFAPACMQSMRILDWYRGMARDFGGSADAFPDLPISEDCLYLNVWTPALDADRKLPVMVYIHGGSNNSGWSWEPNYHGQALAAHGVVVVTIAYRLGVFGFFSHPALNGSEAQANFGLWDQLAALRWVNQQISRFGGDPARVTVFGESAGAQDIAALMLSGRAAGLLQRAILQSTPRLGLPVAETLAAEQARGTALARALNASAPPGLEAMKQIPAAALLAKAAGAFPDHYHAPVIDGVIVTAQTRDLLDAGKFPVQSILIGTNANEWYASTPERPAAAALDSALESAAVLRTAEVKSLLQASPEPRTALDRLRTADSMLCPSQYVAARLAAAGHPAWMYVFSRVREGPAGAALKAYHGAELPYVFGTHDAWMPTTDIDRKLTAQVMRYWVQFASTGDPNTPDNPPWPAYTGPAYSAQQLGVQVGSLARPEAQLCQLYSQLLGNQKISQD